MKKRIMSALLAVCLILTVIPNLALEAKAATPTIQGKVVDTMGRPVPASISVSAQGNTSSPLATTTASETTGQFTLSRSGGFTDGTYVIKVEYSICVTTTTTISLSSSDGFIIAAPITMKLAGRASGTVTDAKTGTGISGVTVNVYTTGGSLMTSTTTGAGGKYKVETEQGSYNIEFSRSGYTTGRLKKVSLSVIETTHDMQLTPSSGGGSQGEIISGEIVSSGTWGKNISWTLDSNGCLVIKGQGDMITYGDNSSLPWRHNKNEITSVFIEDGVTNICLYAFEGCDNLTDITMPNSLKSIESGAFKDCKSLHNVIIPNSVTHMDTGVFSGCISLTSVRLSNSITNIPQYTFSNCKKLIQVEIPHGITGIGFQAFSSCEKLSTISIPNSVTWLEDGVFRDLNGLKSITIPGSIKNIPDSAFNSCHNLSEVIISSGVTNIGRRSFADCKKLKKIAIPDTVCNIESYAFDGCDQLETLSLPAEITSIKPYTFIRCSLSKIVIPDGVTDIGDGAFLYCALKTVIMPKSILTIGKDAFGETTNIEDVFFSGSKSEWDGISIESGNVMLEWATLHLNSTELDVEPTPTPPSNNTELQSLASDWETAYTSYTEAIRKKLNISAQVNLKAGSLQQLAEKFEASLGKEYGLQVVTTGLTIIALSRRLKAVTVVTCFPCWTEQRISAFLIRALRII